MARSMSPSTWPRERSVPTEPAQMSRGNKRSDHQRLRGGPGGGGPVCKAAPFKAQHSACMETQKNTTLRQYQTATFKRKRTFVLCRPQKRRPSTRYPQGVLCSVHRTPGTLAGSAAGGGWAKGANRIARVGGYW